MLVRINNELKLDNGAIAKYFIVGMASIEDSTLSIVVDGFINKDYFENKAMTKHKLLAKHREYVKEYDELNSKEVMTEELRLALCESQEKINTNADLINTTDDYSTFVIFSKEYKFKVNETKMNESFENFVISELNKTEEFKNATLDTEESEDNNG